jgi:hypothetical protein
MKVTFCLPAHPWYFDDEFTQKDIDRALQDMDRQASGIIFKGVRSDPEVKWEFILLREPEKSITVVLDNSLTRGQPGEIPNERGEQSADQYRLISNQNLISYVETLKAILRRNRQRKTWPWI